MREEEKEEKRGEMVDRSQIYRRGTEFEMKYAGCCCVHDSIHIFTDIYISYNSSILHQTKTFFFWHEF